MNRTVKTALRKLGLLGLVRGARLRTRAETAFLRQFVRRGSLCFDIGANVGSCVWKYERLGARVVAVEPQAENFRFLLEEFEGNKNVVLIDKGLDAAPGTRELFVCDDNAMVSSMSPEWMTATKRSGRLEGVEWKRSQTVEVTTLDALIEKYGLPDFCKIDVEGYEYNVLQGLSRPLKVLSFEFTPEHLDPTLKCIDRLCELGRVEFNIALKRSAEFALPKWTDGDAMKRRVAEIPPDVYEGAAGDLYARFA